jgi:hypothetical protein
MLSVLKYSMAIVSLISVSAFAQESDGEFMCKTKAKEIAAETYRNCITESRNSKIDQIRDEYKSKLAALKNHYESELKSLTGETGSKSKKSLANKTVSNRKSVSKAQTPAPDALDQMIEDSGRPTVENEDGSAIDGM